MKRGCRFGFFLCHIGEGVGAAVAWLSRLLLLLVVLVKVSSRDSKLANCKRLVRSICRTDRVGFLPGDLSKEDLGRRTTVAAEERFVAVVLLGDVSMCDAGATRFSKCVPPSIAPVALLAMTCRSAGLARHAISNSSAVRGRRTFVLAPIWDRDEHDAAVDTVSVPSAVLSYGVHEPLDLDRLDRT